MKKIYLLIFSIIVCLFSLNALKYLNHKEIKMFSEENITYLNLHKLTFSSESSVKNSKLINQQIQLLKVNISPFYSKDNDSIIVCLSIGSDNKNLTTKGSFQIDVQQTKINIIASNEIGVINGLNELEKIIHYNNGKLILYSKTFIPKINKRIAHLVFLNKCNISKMKSYIDQARFSHFNYLIFQIQNHVKLSSMNWISEKDSWSKEDFVQIVNYAKKYQISVIPELKLLTHQDWFFSEKKYLFNKHTYDPNNKEVYKVVFSVIDELIEICNPEYFHIGHDELAGLWKAKIKGKLEEDEEILPANLFVKDVLIINEYLKSKKIITLMWADMFLMAEDFPKMVQRGFNANESYKECINQIPKEIILCDWRYFDKNDFSSYSYLTRKGFNTFGTTWWDSEATDAYLSFFVKNSSFLNSGFISCTWEGAVNKLNEKENIKQSVSDIIRKGGELMWNIISH